MCLNMSTTLMDRLPRGRRGTLLIVAVILGVVVVASGVGAATALLLSNHITATPSTAATAIAAPAANAAQAANDAACTAVAKESSRNPDRNALAGIAAAGMNASDEDVRKQSKELSDLLNQKSTDHRVNRAIARQVHDLKTACDHANDGDHHDNNENS